MLYYRVNRDIVIQPQLGRRKCPYPLTQHELLTPTEWNKLNARYVFPPNAVTRVVLSPKNNYTLFGCRFECGTDWNHIENSQALILKKRKQTNGRNTDCKTEER